MVRNSFNVVFMLILKYSVLKVVLARKSKIEERLDAIEYLVRGEMYFVRKDIQTDREEREQFIKKLNETLETLVVNGKATVTDDLSVGEVDINDLAKLSNKVGQNSVAIEEITGELLRNRRGLMAEKLARKLEQNMSISQMKKLQQTQEDLVTNQKLILKHLSAIIQNQNQSMNGPGGLQTEIEYIVGQVIDLRNATDELTQRIKLYEQKVGDTLKMCADNVMTSTTHISKARTTTELITETETTVAETAEITSGIPNIIPDGTIRLVGGRDEYEGRVEVSYGGVYGTVCDDLWDDRDAMVVCRVLGYRGGIGYRGRGSASGHSPQHEFGPGVGKILLDDVECRGDEDSLLSCYHDGIGVNDCNHNEDAGVKCDP